MKEPRLKDRQFSIWVEIVANTIMAIGSVWDLVFSILIHIPLSIFGKCYYRGGGLIFDELAYDMIQQDRIKRMANKWAKEDSENEMRNQSHPLVSVEVESAT